MVAGRGAWVMPAVRFREQRGDATVQAALLSKQVTVAGADATETDSAVAAPVVDESGVVLGMIALRGLPDGGLRAADLLDLAVVAQWLAPALTRPQTEPARELLITDKQRVTALRRVAADPRVERYLGSPDPDSTLERAASDALRKALNHTDKP